MPDNTGQITADQISKEVAAAMREYRKLRYPKYPSNRREYYQRNKILMNEKSRAYYQKHRETILARANSNYAKLKDSQK